MAARRAPGEALAPDPRHLARSFGECPAVRVAHERPSSAPGLGALPRFRRDDRRLRAPSRRGPAGSGARPRARSGGEGSRRRARGRHRAADRGDRPLARLERRRRGGHPRRRAPEGRRPARVVRLGRCSASRRGGTGARAPRHGRGRERRGGLRGQGELSCAPLSGRPGPQERLRRRRERARESRVRGPARLLGGRDPAPGHPQGGGHRRVHGRAAVHRAHPGLRRRRRDRRRRFSNRQLDGGISVLAGPERPTGAHHRLPDVGSVVAWLRGIPGALAG